MRLLVAGSNRRMHNLSSFCRVRSVHELSIRQYAAGLTTTTASRLLPRMDVAYRPTTDKDFVLLRGDGLRCTYRSFSTAPEPAVRPLSLRSMVKPFLLKFHPDVQRSDSARKINLIAIQNLNSYLDTLQTISSGKVTRYPDNRIVEIDFVLQLEEDSNNNKIPLGIRKKKKLAAASGVHSSRRKVELLLPPARLCDEAALTNNKNARSRQLLDHHAMQEIVKLLKVAGLAIPAAVQDSNDNSDQAAALQDAWEQDLGVGEYNESPETEDMSRPHFNYKSRPQTTHYERSRQRFTANINWKRYDELYREAVVDMNADIATHGFIGDNRNARRNMIANIVANVRVQDTSIDVLEQLTAARRLSLLLDDKFDDLHMEDYGNMWENMVLVLTPSRDYNVSSSARHRRRLRSQHSDFVFTLHPDYSVTIHVPIDFRDDELIQELDRNMWDFYNLVGDGMEGLYPEY